MCVINESYLLDAVFFAYSLSLPPVLPHLKRKLAYPFLLLQDCSTPLAGLEMHSVWIGTILDAAKSARPLRGLSSLFFHLGCGDLEREFLLFTLVSEVASRPTCSLGN